MCHISNSMRMRRLLLVFLIVFTTVTALFAQSNSNISVTSLRPLTNDTEASRAHRLDNRGKNCALIRILTPNLNAEERSKIKIKADQGTEVFLEKGDGELKLFLTEGVRKLRIMHDDYGRLDYNVPIDIEGFKTYEMVVNVDKSAFMQVGVGVPTGPKLSSNYVQVEVTPADASIIIDDVPRPDGTAYLTLDDDHTLVVSKALYHTHTQTIRASKNKKEIYKVNLAPAFGYLEITSQPEDGAVVFIDGIENDIFQTFCQAAERIPIGCILLQKSGSAIPDAGDINQFGSEAGTERFPDMPGFNHDDPSEEELLHLI